MRNFSDYIHVISKSQLFFGTSENEISSMLNCLNAKIHSFSKSSYVLRAGDKTGSVYMVLFGNVVILNTDYWGNRNIISKVGAKEIFAESFACKKNSIVSCDCICENNCVIMEMDASKILTVCKSSCEFHNRLIQNLLNAVAMKNLSMNEKLTCISKRTTKEKLLSYFSTQALKNNNNEFDIPFNRQQLADYLFVERSAMSNEMCKLRDEGLIEFNKNHIKLCVPVSQF